MTLKFENAKIYFIQSVASPNLPIYINSTTAVRLCSSISQLKQRFNKNKLLKSEDDLKKIFESKKFKYCLIKKLPIRTNYRHLDGPDSPECRKRHSVVGIELAATF